MSEVRKTVQDWIEVPPAAMHRVLGPRTVYLIGSQRADDEDHLCAASNLTCIGNDPQLVALALFPAWETTSNIIRTRRFSISVTDNRYTDGVWIAGHRYAGISIPKHANKFTAAGFTPTTVEPGYPAGVGEAIAMLACDVIRVIDDLSDHTLILATVVKAQCRGELYDHEFILDTARIHPLLQLGGARFARAEPDRAPSSHWCQRLVSLNLSRHSEKQN